MTPYEITLAQKGMIHRIEMQGNVMLMALRQRDAKKAKPIKLLSENEQKGKSNASVKKSTLEARKNTLQALGRLM